MCILVNDKSAAIGYCIRVNGTSSTGANDLENKNIHPSYSTIDGLEIW